LVIGYRPNDGVPECAGSEGRTREPGCATAGLAEVNVLLDGLQSPSVALREVSIQVTTTTHSHHYYTYYHYYNDQFSFLMEINH